MRKTGLMLIVLLAASHAASSASAADCSVLLDVSGSMQGFEGSDGHQRTPFTAFLDQLQSLCPNGYVFGDPNPLVPKSKRGDYLVPATTPDGSRRVPLSQFFLNNSNTNLGHAAEIWSKSVNSDGVAVIVTDNVADLNSAASKDEQARFSTAITRPDVSELAAITARFPFSGLVFDPTDNRHHSLYNGPRALAIYLVRKGLSGTFATMFDRVSAIAADSAQGTQKIQIRPLIDYSLPQAAFNRATSDIGGSVVIDRGVLHIPSHPLDKSQTITIAVSLTAPEAWRLTVSARVDIRVDPPVGSDLDPLSATAHVEPAKSVTVTKEVPRQIYVVIPIGAIDYKANADLGPILGRLLHPGEDNAHGSGKLTLRIKYDQIKLTPHVTTVWDYCGKPEQLSEPAQEIQEKLYCLGNVTADIVNKAVHVEHPFVLKIDSSAKLPAWPLYIFVAFASLVAAVVAGWLLVIAQRREFDIINDAGEARKVVLGFGNATVIASRDDSVRLRLRRWVMFFYATSAQPIASGRVLWGDRGGTVILLAGARYDDPLAGFLRVVEKLSRRLGIRDRSNTDASSVSKPIGLEMTYPFRIVASVQMRTAQTTRKAEFEL